MGPGSLLVEEKLDDWMSQIGSSIRTGYDDLPFFNHDSGFSPLSCAAVGMDASAVSQA